MNIFDKVSVFDLKKAGLINLAVGGINVLIHISVIAGLLPYMWVNGGRTESYEMACSISASSIVVTLIGMFITLVGAKIIPVKFNRFWGIAFTVFLMAMLPLAFVGIVQQFWGTLFEKSFCSILTIAGFLTSFRIAFEKRWPPKKG